MHEGGTADSILPPATDMSIPQIQVYYFIIVCLLFLTQLSVNDIFVVLFCFGYACVDAVLVKIIDGSCVGVGDRDIQIVCFYTVRNLAVIADRLFLHRQESCRNSHYSHRS